MIDVLGAAFATIVALTVAAALIYIGGFLVSMIASMFGAISDAATHHHHRGQPLLG